MSIPPARALLLTTVLTALCGASPTRPPAVTWTEPVTGMPFVAIAAGSFEMGSPGGERGREGQERLHRVTITRPFWMGTREVTQAEWRRVMATAPSHFRGDDLPVERVSWHDAQAFLARLSALSPGPRFRLPTEAEWEYVCRAGHRTAYASGEALTPVDANVAVVEQGVLGGLRRTTPVGAFAPNAWGVFDMHGNVWEWTEDAHCAYATAPQRDPVGECGVDLKVIRGGSWYFTADSARCALRYTHRPQDVGFSLGFRAVRDAE